jgi:hypothetical protein
VLDLTRLTLSSVLVRVERSFRFVVGLTSDEPISGAAGVLICCSSGSEDSARADEDGFGFSAGSFGGVARGVFGVGEGGNGELRLTFDFLCVDQSPCMDLIDSDIPKRPF